MSDEYVMELVLPDGAIAQHGVMVVGYFNEEGTSCYGFATKGEAQLSSVLGLLELVKLHAVADAGLDDEADGG